MKNKWIKVKYLYYAVVNYEPDFTDFGTMIFGSTPQELADDYELRIPNKALRNYNILKSLIWDYGDKEGELNELQIRRIKVDWRFLSEKSFLKRNHIDKSQQNR